MITPLIIKGDIIHACRPREKAGASRSTRFSPRDGEDGEEPENGLKSLVRPENMHFFPGAPQANFSRKLRNVRNNLEMEIPGLVRHSPNKRTWDRRDNSYFPARMPLVLGGGLQLAYRGRSGVKCSELEGAIHRCEGGTSARLLGT